MRHVVSTSQPIFCSGRPFCVSPAEFLQYVGIMTDSVVSEIGKEAVFDLMERVMVCHRKISPPHTLTGHKIVHVHINIPEEGLNFSWDEFPKKGSQLLVQDGSIRTGGGVVWGG